MQKDTASFRDPSGYVYIDQDTVYRTVTTVYQKDWSTIEKSGLLQKAIESKMMLAYVECKKESIPFLENEQKNIYKVLSVEKLPFISYPYEWCFSQLKDAALLTLALHRLALEHACILKDASAYNVQFTNGKPVFIDLLSFEPWKEGQAWQAYGQFCEHFLAPLTLMAKCDLRCGLLSQQWLGGIPLDLASKMLPKSSYFSLGTYLHLHLHASMKNKHADGRDAADKVKKTTLNLQQMFDIVDSLTSAIRKLTPKAQKTEWGDYYEDTNYTDKARNAKIDAVKSVATRYSGDIALDLGANNGFFSKLLCESFKCVIASDIDPLAVEYNYNSEKNPSNMYPLILDFTNPSSGIGYAGIERTSFATRCHANFVIALALCHHLVITGALSFDQIASYIASLLVQDGVLAVEFIDKADSQIKRLLATRDDVFLDYNKENFLKAFGDNGFELLEEFVFPESHRSLCIFMLKSMP